MRLLLISNWMLYNKDDITRDFVQLGLEVKAAKLASITARSLMAFPSIEGITYPSRKKGWMTTADSAVLRRFWSTRISHHL